MHEIKLRPAPPPSGPPRLHIRGRDVRAVYLWAGDATIDLQRVKFPDLPVDEVAHRNAHTPDAAAALAEAGFTWVFLSMNWGFPPELEAAHWTQFERAAAVYRDAGIRVLGYVQASNCVARGSYAGRDWYARTHRGRTVPYFRDRLMTCWSSPEWHAEVGAHAVRAMELGADGVFFDNVWMGATPWLMGLRVGGFAGCACPRCRDAFRADTGLEVPRSIREDDASARYLAWRAALVQKRLRSWAGRVRGRYPDAALLVNSCDAALRDTRALFGYDLAAASRVQDALLVENVAMPGWERRRRRLTANALPLKAVQAMAADRPVLGLTYEAGIGLDRAPRPERLRRTIAETLAVGAAPVVKGSEYLDSRGRFSVLTAPDLSAARRAAADVLRWAAANPGLFRGAPDPEVVVPYEADAGGWADHAPGAFALGLALIREGISFRYARPGTEVEGARVLRPAGPAARRSLRAAHHPWARAVAAPFLALFTRLYFGSARVRRAVDATGLTRWFLRSPFFTLPRDIDPFSGGTGERRRPYVTAEEPVLVERYRDGRRTLLHLVNYDDEPVRVLLHADAEPRLRSPDPRTRWVRDVPSGPPALQLETYAVLEWET